MTESAGELDPVRAVRSEPFMVIDRIAQEVITQQLNAALEQLDIITNAIREDDEATNISLVYVSIVNARACLDAALKQLPWAPLGREQAPRRQPPTAAARLRVPVITTPRGSSARPSRPPA